MIYDETFYDMVAATSGPSAAVLVPQLIELLGGPELVLDVGCGEGEWLAAFAHCGVPDGVGIDGRHVNVDRLKIPPEAFIAHELERALPVDDLAVQYDVVLCLEVAEHLSAERAPSFITDLCALAPTVVFSAAVPGQGGVGHVNEQWPAYWQRLFNAEHFAVTGAFRYEIWNDDRIENWYRQNLLIACDLRLQPRTTQLRALFEIDGADPLPLVHPVLFQHTHFRNRR